MLVYFFPSTNTREPLFGKDILFFFQTSRSPECNIREHTGSPYGQSISLFAPSNLTESARVKVAIVLSGKWHR